MSFIVNPNYVIKKGKLESRLLLLSPIIDNFIKDLPTHDKLIDFEDIRSFVDKLKYKDEFGVLQGQDLTDEVIIMICDDKGIGYE